MHVWQGKILENMILSWKVVASTYWVTLCKTDIWVWQIGEQNLETNNIPPPFQPALLKMIFHVGKIGVVFISLLMRASFFSACAAFRTTQVLRNLGGCHSGLEDGQQVLSGMARRTYTKGEWMFDFDKGRDQNGSKGQG